MAQAWSNFVYVVRTVFDTPLDIYGFFHFIHFLESSTNSPAGKHAGSFGQNIMNRFVDSLAIAEAYPSVSPLKTEDTYRRQ